MCTQTKTGPEICILIEYYFNPGFQTFCFAFGLVGGDCNYFYSFVLSNTLLLLECTSVAWNSVTSSEACKLEHIPAAVCTRVVPKVMSDNLFVK